MQEIPRAILLPPPSQLSKGASARAVQADSESSIDAIRARHPAPGGAQTFLTLIETRPEDTVEIKGKQFRFRPYNSRGGAEGGAREADLSREAIGAEPAHVESGEDDVSIDIFEGFGAGARERNSSAFVASFIAQERLRQGLHNPQFEAASDAYRRAGGSPSAVDNEPRVLSFEV